MSAYHQNVLLERFIAGGGELPHSVVVGIGGDWYEDVKALRRRGCFIERIESDGWDRWRLHLDTIPEPELDAGRAVDAGASSAPVTDRIDSSPGTVPDPQVEGETPPLFETEQPSPPTPYDVEAA